MFSDDFITVMSLLNISMAPADSTQFYGLFYSNGMGGCLNISVKVEGTSMNAFFFLIANIKGSKKCSPCKAYSWVQNLES